MIASLPMYDLPELRPANDRFWALIRDELQVDGVDAPSALSRPTQDLLSHWRSPDLVLSQTCGMPLRLVLRGDVDLVGTPDYGVDGCPPGYYCSRFIVRAGDRRSTLEEFSAARFAFNEKMSQSGYSAPLTHLEARALTIAHHVETGSHTASARAVADGAADIAALDAVSWRLLQRHGSESSALRVLESTAPTPGLPYICATDRDSDLIHGAVSRAISRLDDADCDALGIRALVSIPRETYASVPSPRHSS